MSLSSSSCSGTALSAAVVLEGAVPYRDIWDDKTPGVFYLNALAFFLFGQTRWAIWVLQTLMLAATAIVVFLSIKRWKNAFLGMLAALITLLIARMPYFTNSGDLLTEGYALLPQSMLLLLGMGYIYKPSSRKAVLIGLSSAAIFLIRQNAISLPLALLPAILLTDIRLVTRRQFWIDVAVMVLSGLVGLGFVALYYASEGALDDAILAWNYQLDHRVWRYGTENIGPVEGLLRLRSSVFSIVFLNPPLLHSALLGCFGGIFVSWRNQRDGLGNDATVAFWALGSVALDLILSNLSGTSFTHYFVTFSVSFSFLIVVALSFVSQNPLHPLTASPWIALLVSVIVSIFGFLRFDLVIYVVILALAAMALYFLYDMKSQLGRKIFTRASVLLPVGLLFFHFIVSVPSNFTNHWSEAALEHPEVAFLRESQQEGDPIVIWGYKPALIFQANLRSPGRIIHHHVVVTPEYTLQMLGEVINAIETNNVQYIVDTAINDGNNIIPPLDSQQREQWLRQGGRADTGDLSELFTWVEMHCTVEETFGDNWIYQCEHN